jgi:hypothetical protein
MAPTLDPLGIVRGIGIRTVISTSSPSIRSGQGRKTGVVEAAAKGHVGQVAPQRLSDDMASSLAGFPGAEGDKGPVGLVQGKGGGPERATPAGGDGS